MHLNVVLPLLLCSTFFSGAPDSVGHIEESAQKVFNTEAQETPKK